MSAPHEAGGTDGRPEPDALKRARTAAATFRVQTHRSVLYIGARVILMTALRVWFRPEIEGRAHVPPDGAAIIAPVHRSNIDFAFMALIADRKLFFMAKQELWNVGWFGRLLERFGVFPVERGGVDRASVRRAEEVLSAGALLVVFPEGTRKSGPVGQLLDGVAFLAARSGAPVVPVGISGTERAMPKGSVLPRPVKVRVALGAPLSPSNGAGTPRPKLSEVSAMTAELRGSLQDLLSELDPPEPPRSRSQVRKSTRA
ncbi:MAG: lysophospholipid acyltransferase family protein [Acidimicrobiales bacterium]